MNALRDIHAYPAAKGYCLILLITLTLYGLTTATGLLWQDSGMIQYRVYTNDIQGGYGLALSHPLFYLIAIAVKNYIPLGSFIHRINLVAAVAAAIGVANIYLLLRLWLGRIFPAVIGAAGLALSHTFWAHACMIETYTLYIALFSAELIMLLQYCRTQRHRYLYGLAMLNGLAIANHMFAAIPFTFYVLLLIYLLFKKQLPLGHLFFAVMCWMVGALPYEYLFIKEWLATGDLWGTLSSAAFGTSWKQNVLNSAINARIVKENILFLGLNFPTPAIVLIPVGLGVMYSVSPNKIFAHLFMAMTLGFGFFASRYTVPDRYAFFIPFYCLCGILIGLGTDFLISKNPSKVLIGLLLAATFLPAAVYYYAPRIAEQTGLNLGVRREIPFRDNYRFFLQPWRYGDNSGDRFSEEALRQAAPNALIYADGTTVYPLVLYQLLNEQRDDITIVSGHGTINNLEKFGKSYIETHLNQPIYAVTALPGYCPAFLLKRFDFEREGVLFRAVHLK